MPRQTLLRHFPFINSLYAGNGKRYNEHGVDFERFAQHHPSVINKEAAFELALWSIGLVLTSATYASAKVAKERETRYAMFWFLFTLPFFVSDLVGVTLYSERLPIPNIRYQSWWQWLVLVGIYFLMILGGSAMAEKENKMEKDDPAEAIAEVGTEAIDIIHEIFKHH